MVTRVLFSTMIFSIVGIGVLQAISVYATNVKPALVIDEIQVEDAPQITAYTPPFPQVEILGKGAFLAKVNLTTGSMTPLYVKNEHQKLPIASISKLLTAYTSIQTKSLNDTYTISEWAVSGPWSSKKFQVGDVYTLRELLEASLVESNNDAARVLASVVGERRFVQNMNMAASALALSESSFFSADGTDRVIENKAVENTSTPHDVAQLITNLYRRAPDLLVVTTKPYVQISDVTGQRVFTAHTTNKLISFFSDGYTLLGGKTGTSLWESKHLVLLFTDLKGDAYVAVVLDSADNFSDMKLILETLTQHNQ
jgi:D-alanyl-D-alanine carboxypeptidase (penicillin-binding protein 5/6)